VLLRPGAPGVRIARASGRMAPLRGAAQRPTGPAQGRCAFARQERENLVSPSHGLTFSRSRVLLPNALTFFFNPRLFLAIAMTIFGRGLNKKNPVARFGFAVMLAA